MTLSRALSIAGLVMAILSLLGSGYPLVPVAVILLALSQLV
jgi:hypothetical protein